jgi:hypothetical protein
VRKLLLTMALTSLLGGASAHAAEVSCLNYGEPTKANTAHAPGKNDASMPPAANTTAKVNPFEGVGPRRSAGGRWRDRGRCLARTGRRSSGSSRWLVTAGTVNWRSIAILFSGRSVWVQTSLLGSIDKVSGNNHLSG